MEWNRGWYRMVSGNIGVFVVMEEVRIGVVRVLLGGEELVIYFKGSYD